MARYVCHLCGTPSDSGWNHGFGHVCSTCEDENQRLDSLRKGVQWVEEIVAKRRRRSLVHHETSPDEVMA